MKKCIVILKYHISFFFRVNYKLNKLVCWLEIETKILF